MLLWLELLKNLLLLCIVLMYCSYVLFLQISHNIDIQRMNILRQLTPSIPAGFSCFLILEDMLDASHMYNCLKLLIWGWNTSGNDGSQGGRAHKQKIPVQLTTQTALLWRWAPKWIQFWLNRWGHKHFYELWLLVLHQLSYEYIDLRYKLTYPMV